MSYLTGTAGTTLPAVGGVVAVEPDGLQELLNQPLTPATLAFAAAVAGMLLLALPLLVAVCAWGGRPRSVRRRLPRLRPPGIARSMSAALLGTASVTSAGLSQPAAAASPVTTLSDHDLAPASAAPHAAAPGPTQLVLVGGAIADAPAVRSGGERVLTCRVRPGDTLSEIARERLGDAARWPEIFTLNRGVRFPKVGGRLTDPDVIYPGWTLTLPADAGPARRTSPAPARPDRPEPPPEPTPTPTAAPTASPLPATGPSSLAPADDPLSAHPDAGVILDGGSWLPVGVAVAVAALAALVWGRRRHRYTPRPPSALPRPADPDLTSLPPTITTIQRRLASPPTPPPPDTAVAPRGGHDPASGAASARHRGSADDEVAPADGVGLAEIAAAGGVLAVTGRGAAAATRGLLIAVLTGPDAAHVVIPALTASALLGQTRLPSAAQLTITVDLDRALTVLETQILHRRAHAATAEPDMAGNDLGEDQPVLLVTEPPSDTDLVRTTAVLDQGRDLGIHAVVLGPAARWPTAIVEPTGPPHPTRPAHWSRRRCRAGSRSCPPPRPATFSLCSPKPVLRSTPRRPPLTAMQQDQHRRPRAHRWRGMTRPRRRP